MTDVSIDRKAVLKEAIRDSLTETGADPEDVAAFDHAFDAMYLVDNSTNAPHAGTETTDGVPLTGEQFADASIITVAFDVAKFFFDLMIDPALEKKVLPNLNRYEEKWSAITGKPELVKSIRIYVERGIRKRLNKSPPP